MKITQAELERRLGLLGNLSSQQADSITPPEPPAAEPKPKVPHSLKIVAGSLAHQMPAKDVAGGLGLSVSQVNSYKYSKDPKVQAGISEALGRVQELAIEKMMQALGLMTFDKMEGSNIKDLSIVAANMGRIIEKTRVSETDTRTQLVIYAPEIREQRSYRVIDV
jgi:hypothetical protein